jgi:TetR/AcrR family transcriptional regulator, transcriptional repressor for nem operon
VLTYTWVIHALTQLIMNKGERTRQQVIEKAAGLFNQRGYEATSISDVMSATGLQKGGVYRHFESKEELTLAAFDFAVGLMRERFVQALANVSDPKARLRAIVGVYERIPIDPPVPGGCPVLNASIEADDANPALRKRAQLVMDDLRRVIKRAVREGQRGGALRPEITPDSVAVVFMCMLEGAVMMSKLYGNQAPMRQAVRHLHEYIETLTI